MKHTCVVAVGTQLKYVNTINARERQLSTSLPSLQALAHSPNLNT
jgi:hypothetical protein